MKQEAEESANRLWYWIAQYGHTKQPEFIADLRAVLEYAFPEDPQPAEDPDEWVELTNPNHVLRRDIDFTNTAMLDTWEPIFAWNGDTIGTIHEWGYKNSRFRCRRRDLPKVEQVRTESESDHVADATKKISDESLELIVHLRDQMQVLANRVAECERVVFAQTPQPTKTRVRLWKNAYGSVMSNPDCENIEGWREIHHDSESFYTIN